MTDAPLLAYPDPAEAPPDPDPGRLADDCVGSGDLIAQRYELQRLLMRRGRALTWLAHDEMLSRAVLVHVLPIGEPRAEHILAMARAAATTTDARFLRVLDADSAAGEPYGAYIVCEYAPGQSLELALREGPFSQLEASWLVREVADGLAAMHARGLYHRQLSPDTVVITASGNVKVVGFLLESALAGHETDGGEFDDVRALGQLLYAALAGRWPTGSAYGQPPAPLDAHGRPFSVDRLVGGLDPALGMLAVDLDEGRVPTAAAVAARLDPVIGGADASHELDRRLRYPLRQLSLTSGTPLPRTFPVRLVPDADPPAPPEVRPAGLGAGARTPTRPDAEGDELDATSPMRFDPAVDDELSPQRPRYGTPVPPPAVRPTNSEPDLDEQPEPEPDHEPVPPPARPRAPRPRTTEAPASRTQAARSASDRSATRTPTERVERPLPSRAWLQIIGVLTVLAIIAALVLTFANPFGTPSAPQPAAPAKLTAADFWDFDPAADGGDDAENTAQARLALDGKADTAWKTERYAKSAAFNGAKPGAGLVVDLGEVKTVNKVVVLLGPGGTDVEIRVPKAGSMSRKTQADWTPIASASGAAGETTLTPKEPIKARYVLVYLTKLPAAVGASGFQGVVNEIVVAAS